MLPPSLSSASGTVADKYFCITVVTAECRNGGSGEGGAWMGSPGKHGVTGSGCGETEGNASGNTVERGHFCLSRDSAGDEWETGRAESWTGPQSSVTVLRESLRVSARVPAAAS